MQDGRERIGAQGSRRDRRPLHGPGAEAELTLGHVPPSRTAPASIRDPAPSSGAGSVLPPGTQAAASRPGLTVNHIDAPAPRAPSEAVDSVIVEYRTIRREPRVLFDSLLRSAFDGVAELAATLADGGPEGVTQLPPLPRIRCSLEPAGPGAYLITFDVPRSQPVPPRPLLLRRRSHPPHGFPQDTVVSTQEALYTGTRIVEELLWAVDTVCSIEGGRLSVSRSESGGRTIVEFIDGVRVLRRIHEVSWDLVRHPQIQDLLRQVLSPFSDPDLYTMALVERPLLGNLGANWAITTNQHLRRFVDGGRLELPDLDDRPCAAS